MSIITPRNIRIWSKLGARGTFGVAMLELGKEHSEVIATTADLSTTSGLDRFKAAYPDRFYNIGISEPNLVNISAGLAKEGYTVFATTFANFAAMRSYEQIRLSLGYMKFPVNIVGLSAGFAMGMFGNTHYGIEDIALMRAVPGLTVLSPADGTEIVKTVFAASKLRVPTYIRLTGVMNNPIVYHEDYDFQIGKAVTLQEGSDITIIATGTMVYEALEAAKLLAEKGISSTVVNMHTIKPLDTTVIDRAIKSTELVVTIEEHSVIGGLGSAVSEYKSTKNNAPPQLFIGIADKFERAGEYDFLLEKFGLKSQQIADKITEVLR
ncbi:MAG: transketolase C-terminal domain-containing protein [Christensenella sp.]